MSSASSSHPNPNPNFNSIKPSPSTQLPKFKCKNRKSHNKNKNKNKLPNWLDLIEDVWSLIFSKLDTICLIENVQKLCMLFRKICKQPSLYKLVDMTLPDDILNLWYNVNIMIVDRSCGGLIDIYLECADDYALMYIVERSQNLKHLRFGHDVDVSDGALIQAIKMLLELEEVHIILCSFSNATIEAIGHACPSLKSFALNHVGSRRLENIYNEKALAIAKSMPNLRNLQLIGSLMNNEGLKAVLDGCPHLASLDLRACFKVDLSGDLGKRCHNIKHLRLPNDSTADYMHQACTDLERVMAHMLRFSYYDYDYDSNDDDDDDDDFYSSYSGTVL